MSDYGDWQAQQEQDAFLAAQEWARQQEAARVAALTSRERTDYYRQKAQALPTPGYGRNALAPQGGDWGGDAAHELAFNQQSQFNDYSYGTSVPTPYLGPTTSVNPVTGRYYRSGRDVGPNVSGVGRAGELPGTQEIINSHLGSDPVALNNLADRGINPFPKESMGRFRLNDDRVTDEEIALQSLAASGQAGPGQLQRLARLRAGRFDFHADDFKRAVKDYYPSVLATVMSAGAGGAGGLAGAAASGGIGAFAAGAQSGWDDPYGIAAGFIGGTLGGWGAGVGAQGWGPVARGAASGAGSAFGASGARNAVHGTFDPVADAKAAATGGVTGAAGGATGVPGGLYSPAVNYGASQIWGDDDRRRKRGRNPFA